MAKYLFKRDGTYYFQKRVLDKETKTYLHIRKSLKTKCCQANSKTEQINSKKCYTLKLKPTIKFTYS